ncbi:MAG: prolipoprotein diacylglyceryl transferase, partial [Ruminococcus sp.]|nr:prolipoprotein diacylglyceryl transferase [Ruminococcus sp.]
IIAFILGRRYRIKLEDILFGELFMLVGAFIGAHILYGITNIPDMFYYLGLYFSEGWDTHYFFDIIFKFMDGMVYFGGLILGIVFGILYCKIRKLDLGNYSDCFAVGIPLFHSIARLGCFFAGCCYGIESDFGFTAHNAIVESANDVCRFPVQLLESGLNALIFVALLLIFRKGIMRGKIIYAYLISYSTIRFFLEFLRGDEYRGFLLFLSTSQWISLVLIGFSVFKLLRSKKKKAKL